MPPQSPTWAVRHCWPQAGTEWELGLFSCSSSLLPSHGATAPHCLTPVLLQAVLGVWGSQGLWGTARWFHMWCVSRTSSHLQLIRFMQHLEVFSQKDVSKLLYSLTCYLSGLCCSVYKTCEGWLEASKRWCWRVHSSAENSIRSVYECWFLCCFVSDYCCLWLSLQFAVSPGSLGASRLQEHNGKWQTGVQVEIREQQPNPLCRNGSRAGSGQHWHRHTLWHLFFWSSFSSQSRMAIGHFWEVAVGGRLWNT